MESSSSSSAETMETSWTPEANRIRVTDSGSSTLLPKSSRIPLENFISLVKSHRFLYDKRCFEFKDISYKEETWNAIGAQVGLTGEQCMIKWKGLRDRYVRIKKEYELKKRENPNARLKKCSWRLYDAMDEILSGSQDGFETILATHEMCKDESILPNSYEEAIGIKSEVTEEPDTIITPQWNDTTPPIMPEESSITIKDKRKRKSNETSIVYIHDHEPSTKKSTLSSTKDFTDLMKNALFEDEVFHFAMNIALRLKKLERWPMLKAMNSIENALFTVEADEAE